MHRRIGPSAFKTCETIDTLKTIGQQAGATTTPALMSPKSNFHHFHRSQPELHTCLHTFNGPLSGTTQVRRYQRGKTNLDFTEARDSEWQWHQLRHMQVCTSLQTDNHASNPLLSFLQAGCPSCRPTNSVKALKAQPEINSK